MEHELVCVSKWRSTLGWKIGAVSSSSGFIDGVLNGVTVEDIEGYGDFRDMVSAVFGGVEDG